MIDYGMDVVMHNQAYIEYFRPDGFCHASCVTMSSLSAAVFHRFPNDSDN